MGGIYHELVVNPHYQKNMSSPIPSILNNAETKLVSVVVPVYNAETYVGETLKSVLAQTYQNFEVIIVDDGGSDRSLEICRQFTDSRIKIVQQANRGLPGARNTGIRHAQGDYITLLDADDLWVPEKLEKHVAHLNASPDVGISFSYSAFIDDNGKPSGLHQMPRKLKNITPAYVLCRNPVGNGSSAVIRRETLQSIEFKDDLYGVEEAFYFDERLRFKNADATDLECWTRIAATTPWHLEGIAESLTLYRIHVGGLSANALVQYEAIERVIEKSCNVTPTLEPYKNLAKAYYLRYVARRAVTLRDGDLAVQMMHRSLSHSLGVLWEEPQRTLVTLGAAYLLKFTPRSLYTNLETTALKITSHFQEQKFQPKSLTTTSLKKQNLMV
jgi:glycosyltransferase involved in cell wall biosynthesis